MWKNWIPFRRKERDEVKKEVSRDHDTGKENEEDIKPNFLDASDDSVSARGLAQSLTPLPLINSDQSIVGKHLRKGMGSHIPSTSNHDSSYSMCQQPQLQNGTSGDHDLSSSRLTRHKRPGGNDSFSAVHGPLLSTPIMPKVRRVIETRSGLRSPMTDRSSLLARGRPIGRSASLNYKSSNPAKSVAGQVPWVRLKRRESVALADIVRGRAPHSPNTIKIASPEPSHLLPAPSFKVTPLIVTTEANRNRVIDTQTVVSALREKRKRIGAAQPEDYVCEETSWQSAAKRRRQDSSQSNASSVSIPPMPDSLPNLMASPDGSMLHIENVSGPRPSTVPSVDAYVNRHIQDVGLGGERIPAMQPLQLPKQGSYPPLAGANKNSNKLTQRALQSSLSSSLRARNNLSLLERGGIDFSRIRSNSIGSISNRRMSFSSDVSMLDKSVDNPLVSMRHPVAQDVNEPTVNMDSNSSSPVSTTKSSPNLSQNLSTVSAPTKRKIAEGVMLRKQNLSINSTNSPLRAQKPPQSGIPVGTLDLEQDRSKEYQRRVLDLLTDNEATPKTTAVETFGKSLPPLASGPSVVPTSSQTSSSLGALSAATSAAVSASLDSLNKLVQSTADNASSQRAPQPPLSTTTTTTISSSTSLSVSGVPSIGSSSLTPSSAEAPSSKSVQAVTSSLLSSILSKPNTPTLSSTPAVSTSMPTVNFSLAQPAAPSLSSASGFQVNFGSVIMSTSATTSAASPSLSASITAAPPAQQFSFGLSSSVSSPLGVSGQASGLSTPLVSGATSSASQVSGGISFGVTSVPSGVSHTFGSLPSSSSTLAAPTQSSSQSKSVVPGFSFGSQSVTTSQPAVAPGAFAFGSTTSAPGSAALSAAPAQALGTGVVSAFGGVSLTAVSQTLGNPGGNATSMTGGFNFKLPSSSTTGSGGGILGIGNAGMSHFSAQLTSTTPSTSSPLNAPSAASASLSQPTGIFGGSVSTTPAATSQGGAGGQAFNFGSAPSQPATASTPQSQPAQGLSFHSPSTQPNPAAGFNFGQAEAPSAGLFTFGGAPASSARSANVAAFGSTVAPSSTAAGPVFAGSHGLNANPQAVFSPPASQVMPAVAFGGTAANFGTGTMSFGETTATATAPAFGASTNSGFNPVSSLASQQPSAFGQSTSAGSPFNFGAQPNTSQPQTFGTSLSTAFGTSPTASTNTPSLFSGNPPGTNAPAFGSATSSGVGVFGGQNTSANPSHHPSVFGSSTTAPAFGSEQTAKPSGFGPGPTQPSIFGSGPLAQASVFGSGSTASQPAIFGSGITSQPSAFGSAPTTQTSAFGSIPATQPSAFGSVPATQPSAFGSIPATQTSAFGSAPSTQPSVFGSGQASQPSVFGSPATTQQSIFGSSQAMQNAPFGSAPTGQATPFGSTPTTQASSFGAGSTGVFGATGAPAFGAMAQNEAKPAFGAVSTTGVSVFGAPKASPFNATAPSAGGAFTFNAGQVGQNAAASNPFNATATSSASTGFNFKPPSEQAANASGGFNFAPQMPQPTFQAPVPKPPSATGFNFSASTPGAPNFNFSATPNTNNMFTPQATGTVHRPRAAARRGVRRGTRR